MPNAMQAGAPFNLNAGVGGRGGFGPENLWAYVNRTLAPLEQQLWGQQQPIQQAFLSYLTDPSAGMDALKKTVGAESTELFKPGGQIANAMRSARGGATKAGWNPSDAFGSETGILQEGTNVLETELAKGSLGLKQQQQQALTGAYGQGWENLFGGAESIFGAGSNIFGLGLAKDQQDIMNQGLFGSIFGNLFR